MHRCMLRVQGLCDAPHGGKKSEEAGGGGGGGAQGLGIRLPLAAPIGPSPLLILTLCGPERALVVSTEHPDDLSCLTPPGDGLLPMPLPRCTVRVYAGVCRLQHRLVRSGGGGGGVTTEH